MKVVMWICSVDGNLVQINDGFVMQCTYLMYLEKVPELVPYF